MLDLGLSKMAVIGVVALVVIGPERLPRVARTVGTLMGRAQRYVNDVKAEVSREMELDELRRAKTAFEEAAHNVKSSFTETVRKHEADLNEAWSGAGALMKPDSTADDAGADASGNSGVTNVSWRTSSTLPPAKRKNWRIKQATLPTWYKRANLTRTRVQSGAARVARHRPDSLKRPTRFF
jgi:sec-independent protein translocase protein TatB